MTFTIHGIFYIIWRQSKVFKKCFHKKFECPVTWPATREEKSGKFLETVIFCKAFRGSFKRKLSSSFPIIWCVYVLISSFKCVLIKYVLISPLYLFIYLFYFTYIANCCSCAMLFSVFHLGIVNICCCLYYIPGFYPKSSMLLCLRCSYCLLFSKIP